MLASFPGLLGMWQHLFLLSIFLWLGIVALHIIKVSRLPNK